MFARRPIPVHGERGPMNVPVGEDGLSSACQGGGRARLPCHRASRMSFGSGWSFTPNRVRESGRIPALVMLFEAGYAGRFKRAMGSPRSWRRATCRERTEPPHLEDTCPLRAFGFRPSRNCQSGSCAQAPSRPEGRSTPGPPTRQPRWGGSARSQRRAEPCRCRTQIDHRSVMADASAVVSLAVHIPTRETVHCVIHAGAIRPRF